MKREDFLDTEKTVVIVKPGFLKCSAAIKEIISALVPAAIVRTVLINGAEQRKQWEDHYAEHKGKSFYEKNLEYVTSDSAFAMIIRGRGVVKKCLDLKSKIRALFAVDVTKNAVHLSDSVEAAEREVGIWFPDYIDSDSEIREDMITRAASGF